LNVRWILLSIADENNSDRANGRVDRALLLTPKLETETMMQQTRSETKKQIRTLEAGYKVAYAEFRRWEDRDRELADTIWEECQTIERQIRELREGLDG
jgi:ribulose bisphosphate carboxylase small subunit